MLKGESKFFRWKYKTKRWELKTDLFAKPTDTYQFLNPTSCHPYHCKKGIPYIQALRVSKIWSYNENFDRHYNVLEKWLMERG